MFVVLQSNEDMAQVILDNVTNYNSLNVADIVIERN